MPITGAQRREDTAGDCESQRRFVIDTTAPTPWVIAIGKDGVAHDVSVTFNAAHVAAWKLYGFTGATALAQTGSGNVNGTSLALAALPAEAAPIQSDAACSQASRIIRAAASSGGRAASASIVCASPAW